MSLHLTQHQHRFLNDLGEAVGDLLGIVVNADNAYNAAQQARRNYRLGQTTVAIFAGVRCANCGRNAAVNAYDLYLLVTGQKASLGKCQGQKQGQRCNEDLDPDSLHYGDLDTRPA